MCVDDRVVWLSDSGPEWGLVRWVGHIPGSRDDYIAGVEFVSWTKYYDRVHVSCGLM